MKAFCFLLVLFLLFNYGVSHAEYRVFLLHITNTQTQDVRLVESTLDPIQYPRYYPVQSYERVTYTETWRCYGRTGNFQPYCPNPKAAPAAESQSQSRAPATNP
jgi:hypothetical protein